MIGFEVYAELPDHVEPERFLHSVLSPTARILTYTCERPMTDVSTWGLLHALYLPAGPITVRARVEWSPWWCYEQ